MIGNETSFISCLIRFPVRVVLFSFSLYFEFSVISDSRSHTNYNRLHFVLKLHLTSFISYLRRWPASFTFLLRCRGGSLCGTLCVQANNKRICLLRPQQPSTELIMGQNTNFHKESSDLLSKKMACIVYIFT